MSYLSSEFSADVAAAVATVLSNPVFIPSDPAVCAAATVWLEQRDDDQHLTLRLTHPTASYMTIAICLMLSPEGGVRLKSAFSSDTMNYVEPDDLERQQDLVACMVGVLQTGLPDLFDGPEHAQTLEDRWEMSKQRALSKLQENDDAGQGVTRMSKVQPYGSKGQKFTYPGIAAPSTRLGSTRIVGVYDHGQSLPRTIYHDRDDKQLTVGYYEHESLQSLEGYSSAEKMEILQGTHPKYAFFYPTFQTAARQGAICLPVARSDLALSQRWYHQDVLNIEATYQNADSCTFDLSQGPSHYLYCSFRLELPRTSSNIWISFDDKDKEFVVERGRTNETRFASVELLHDALKTALRCLLDIDPVWPGWIAPYFSDAFDPKHPLLAGVRVPARHQGYVALLLGKAYDKALKGAQKREALIAKKAAAANASAADQDAYPDGTIFAFLKKGARADQADLKSSDIRRMFVLITDREAKSKKRRRVLEPLSIGYNTKPYTPKNRINFEPLKHADAVRLLSDFHMGWEGRDHVEMSHRLALMLSGDAENPLLSGEGTIEIVDWAGGGAKIRVSKMQSREAQHLLALRIMRPTHKGSALDASAGIAFLTYGQHALTVALPSTFDVQDRLPRAERDILMNYISATQGSNAEALNRRLRVAFAQGYLSPV